MENIKQDPVNANENLTSQTEREWLEATYNAVEVSKNYDLLLHEAEMASPEIKNKVNGFLQSLQREREDFLSAKGLNNNQ
jgi:hypothetical protein